MNKKFLFILTTILWVVSKAGATIVVDPTKNTGIDYSTGDTTVIKGSVSVEVTVPEKSYGSDYIYSNVTITEVTTYNNAQNEIEIIPNSFNKTTFLNLDGWRKSTDEAYYLGRGQEINITDLEFTEDLVTVSNQEIYDLYVKYIGYIAKSVEATTSRGGSGIRSGKILLGKGYTVEADGATPISPIYYYNCSWSRGEATYSNINGIIGIVGNYQKDKEYVGTCFDDYVIKTIPNNFITAEAKSIKIPSSLITIEDDAFAEASNLALITECSSPNFDLETETDGTQYLFEVDNSGNKTLVFATASNKVTVLDWDETYVGIKDNALKFRSNLTINTENPISYTSAKGANTVVQKKASTTPATWNFANGICTVTGAVTRDLMLSLIGDFESNICTYVDMTGADITENLVIAEIDDEIQNVDIANTNIIFNFSSSTFAPGVTVAAGTNVVIDGICSNLVLTEAANYNCPANFTAENASVVGRNIGTNWSTVCLPFSVTGSQLINNFKFGVFDSYEKSANSFTFELAGVEGIISANVPYIIKSREGNKPLSFTNVSVSSTIGEDLITPANEAAFIGTYEGVVLSGGDGYEYYGFSSNVIKRANGTNCKRFRAYLRGPEDAWTYAGSLRIVDASGDEKEILEFENTTGIENVKTFESEAVIYNVNGQKLNEAKGLVVKNGTKMIIK